MRIYCAIDLKDGLETSVLSMQWNAHWHLLIHCMLNNKTIYTCIIIYTQRHLLSYHEALRNTQKTYKSYVAVLTVWYVSNSLSFKCSWKVPASLKSVRKENQVLFAHIDPPPTWRQCLSFLSVFQPFQLMDINAPLTRWINSVHCHFHLVHLPLAVLTPLRPTASHQNQRWYVPISHSDHTAIRGPRHVDHAVRTLQQAANGVEPAARNNLFIGGSVSGGPRFVQTEPLLATELDDGLRVGVERDHGGPHAAAEGHPGETEKRRLRRSATYQQSL